MKDDQQKNGSGNTADTKDGNETVMLDEDLELTDAGALLGQLQAVAATNSEIVVDGSQVRVIDTAILQLLVAFFCQARERKLGIGWQQPSDTLCNTAMLLGMDIHLGLAATDT